MPIKRRENDSQTLPSSTHTDLHPAFPENLFLIRHQRLAHALTDTMEGSPGVRCYHGLMIDSIEIARLNAEAVRVVTNITSDIANLEEGGTDPPSRPHGFQLVTRGTAGVDSQGRKDAKRRRHEGEKMIGNTDRWIACFIDVPRSQHEESR